MKKLMKKLVKPVAVTVLAGLSLYTIADTDFSRIKKDVSVMSNILKGSFESDKTIRGVRIDGNYLAGQGVVFAIDAPHSFSYTYTFDGEDAHFFPDSTVPVAPNVENISESVAVALEALQDTDREWVVDIPRLRHLRFEIDQNIQHLDRETRVAIREVGHDIREVQREISEIEIQLIHTEEAADRKELEQEIDRLNQELAKHEKKQTELEANLAEERNKIREHRAELREKMLAKQKEHLGMLEATVMQSLCDYGSTLRNLPSGEHVTIIFEDVSDSDERQIYVFNKDDVTRCRSDGQTLKSEATAYLF